MCFQGRPSWMVTLHQSAATWLSHLPESVPNLRRTLDNIKDPLYRYFEREVNSGAKLLRVVKSDLNDVLLICKVCAVQICPYFESSSSIVYQLSHIHYGVDV